MLDDVLSFRGGWTLVEDQLAAAPVPTGPLFTTSNGAVGVRGGHREPVGGGGGALVCGAYETRPFAHPERAFGFPDDYQTLVEVTDPTVVAVTVDGAPVAGDAGTWIEHERALDLRTGCVTTTGRWRAPHGATVAVRSRRMACLDDPGLLWTSVEVEPEDREVDVEIVTVLQANTRNETYPDEPEALARAWGRVWTPAGTLQRDELVGLAHRTAFSGRAVACVAAVEAPVGAGDRRVSDDEASVRHRGTAAPGRSLLVVQRSAFAVGAAADAQRLLERAAAQVTSARGTTFDDAVGGQRAALDRFWDAAAVDVDGDPDVEGALRYAIFQVLQATARNPGRAAAAKGLTGQGYQGHHLWDQEIYVGQALSLLAPGPARALLSFRRDTLPAARERAEVLSLAGAQFPWRTIDGREASALFTAGAAQHHVDAAVSWAIDRYVACTGDDGFLADGGLEVLVETARMWASIGHFGRDGTYRIETVTGPDEYSALVDNNLYTNVMAAWNLEAAAAHVERLAERDPDAHAALVRAVGLDDDELGAWRRAAAAMFVPYDAELGVHGQDDGFLRKERWDLEGTFEERVALQDDHHLLTLYRRQVIKQADVVLALFLQRERFDPDQRRRDFDHYAGLTAHDSSLSAPVHAIVAADVGHLDAAWCFLRDAALADLDGRHGTPADGLHVAAAAGAWLAVACGFGGFSVRGDRPAFRPQLPAAIGRLRFRVRFRGALVEAEIEPGSTTYRLLDGEAVTLLHGDEEVHLAAGGSAARPTG